MSKITTLLFPVLLSMSLVASAQEYSVEYSTRNYEPLVNANLLDESNPNLDGSGNDLYQPIPIGFDFTYHGMSYNSLEVGENGYVIFTANNVFESFINIYECPQMNYQDSALLSPIYYEVSGNPGERIFKLEFVKSGFVNDAEEDDYVNYQLWLYEYCNSFEFHFGEVAINPAELDLFYNNSSAPFIGYGANNPYFFYTLSGNPVSPILQTNPTNTLDSVPDSSSVYTFRNCYANVVEEEKNSFSIHPNPASDFVVIDFIEEMLEPEMSILNLSGQVVYKDLLPTTDKYLFDTEFLSQGIYIVKIKSATINYSTKLVIE